MQCQDLWPGTCLIWLSFWMPWLITTPSESLSLPGLHMWQRYLRDCAVLYTSSATCSSSCLLQCVDKMADQPDDGYLEL